MILVLSVLILCLGLVPGALAFYIPGPPLPPPPSKPPTPTLLEFDTIRNYDGKVKLDWNIASGATTYEIERSLDRYSGYSVIHTTGSYPTYWWDTGVEAINRYFYRVRAHNSAGYSGYSTVRYAEFYDSEFAPHDMWIDYRDNWQYYVGTDLSTDIPDTKANVLTAISENDGSKANFQICYNNDEPSLLKNQVCICFYIGVPPGYQDHDDCPTMYDEITHMELKWSCDNENVRLALGIDGATGAYSMQILGWGSIGLEDQGFTMENFDLGVMVGAVTPGEYVIEITGAFNDDFNFCFYSNGDGDIDGSIVSIDYCRLYCGDLLF